MTLAGAIRDEHTRDHGTLIRRHIQVLTPSSLRTLKMPWRRQLT
jgi:hypothetical protein